MDKLDTLKTPTLIEELIFRGMKSLADEKTAQLKYCEEMKLPEDSVRDEIKALDNKIKLCSVLLKDL